MIVDEAFYDFFLTTIVRSITLRGFIQINRYSFVDENVCDSRLRLRLFVANQKSSLNLAHYQPHWSINRVALRLESLYSRKRIYKKSQIYIREERDRLLSFCKQNGFESSSSKVNFYLLRDPDAEDQYPFFEFLMQKGIIPRHTFNFPGLEGIGCGSRLKARKKIDAYGGVRGMANVHPNLYYRRS